MEKRKIAHVLYAGLGGHGNVVFPLLETTFGIDFDHVLVFYGVEPILPDYKAKCEKLKIPYFKIQKRRGQYLGPFRTFTDIIQKTNPSAIIVHNSELIIPAVRYSKQDNNCKAFYVEHQDIKTKNFTLRFLSRYALKKANSVICLSETYKKELVKRHKSKVPVNVIPNGISTEKYIPKNKDTGSITFGMASRMTSTKDHKTLLNAFNIVVQNHPDIRLKIAGDGETLTDIKKYCATLKLSTSVEFLGLLDEAAMLNFYQKINIFVLATTSETLSTAILQAMSCGLPVLTADIENNKLLITEGVTGRFYINRDAEDLASKMEDMLSHYQQSLKLGVAARTHVITTYSLEKMSEQYSALLT